MTWMHLDRRLSKTWLSKIIKFSVNDIDSSLSCSKLDGINQEVKIQMQSSKLEKVVQKDRIAENIKTFQRKIEDAYQKCQVKHS
jgi:hypothetical protein